MMAALAGIEPAFQELNTVSEWLWLKVAVAACCMF